MKFIFAFLLAYSSLIQVSIAAEKTTYPVPKYAVNCFYSYDLKGVRHTNIGSPVHLGQLAVELGGVSVGGMILKDENLKVAASVHFSNGSLVGVAKGFFYLITCLPTSSNSNLANVCENQQEWVWSSFSGTSVPLDLNAILVPLVDEVDVSAIPMSSSIPSGIRDLMISCNVKKAP